MSTDNPPKGYIDDGIKRSNLLSVSGSLVTGLLFFFALSSELVEKNLVLVAMFVPFYIFVLVLSFLVTEHRTVRFARNLLVYGVVALAVSVSIIVFDNISGGIYSRALSIILGIPPNQTSSGNTTNQTTTNSTPLFNLGRGGDDAFRM